MLFNNNFAQSCSNSNIKDLDKSLQSYGFLDWGWEGIAWLNPHRMIMIEKGPGESMPKIWHSRPQSTFKHNSVIREPENRGMYVSCTNQFPGWLAKNYWKGKSSPSQKKEKENMLPNIFLKLWNSQLTSVCWSKNITQSSPWSLKYFSHYTGFKDNVSNVAQLKVSA